MRIAMGAVLAVLTELAGCGTAKPPSDMALRSAEYYAQHPEEIGPMQAICVQWSGSKLPAEAQPAVVTNNCRAAAQAKRHLSVVNPFTGAKAR